jgi:hypothetical protein
LVVFGSHRRAIRALMDVIGSREIAAGVKLAHLERESHNAHRQPLAHDVSILTGVGRHLGSQPRANTSMTIMRAPQQGHGEGNTRGASGATSGCSCASATGLVTLRSVRAVAMLSARVADKDRLACFFDIVIKRTR